MALSDILQKVGNNEPLTDEERQELRDETRALDEVISVVKRIIQPGSGSILLSGVRITNGKIVGTDFLALAPSVLTENPTDAGFTGTFMSGGGETFNGDVYNIGGVAAGVLQWGANQSNGKIYFGGGDGWLDQFGLTFKNQEGFVQWLDTLGGGTMVVYSDGDNYLVFENSFGDKGFSFLIDDAAHAVIENTFSATFTYFNVGLSDVDFVIRGTSDGSLFSLDAGTNRIGIGVAAPGYKLDVNGSVNVATGSTFKVNGTDVLSATKTGRTDEELQDLVGAMTTGNTETGITVTYQDSDGTIDFELTASVNAGWVEVSDSWTYNTAQDINIPSDGTLIYQPGMKIRFKQGGGYKYAIALGVSATKITIFTNTDYTVANSAITDVAYSYAENPFGWPNDFAWTPSIANLTTTSGTYEAFYNVQGRRVQGHLSFTFGASSAIGGSLTLTFPATPATYTKTTPIGFCRFKDATGGNAAVGIVFSNGAITVSNAAGTYLISDVLSSTVPFTWATNDDFEVDFDYFF